MNLNSLLLSYVFQRESIMFLYIIVLISNLFWAYLLRLKSNSGLSRVRA